MTKRIIYLVLIAVGAVAVIWAASAIVGHFDHSKDQKFDEAEKAKQQQQEEYQKQIQDLQGKWDDAIKQAQTAESKAAALESQRVSDQQKINAAHAQAASFQGKYQQEAKRYADALANSNSSQLDPCALWISNCTKAKNLGLKPSSEPCQCK